MRIFFVTNNYIPYSGGVTQAIIATTDALRQQGNQVFIITLDFLGKKNKPQTGVIHVPCPITFMYKKNYMAIPWRPTHFITQLLQQYKPDIVHVHHPFLLGVSALHAARACNIPCVFTYHTMYEDYAHYVPLPRYFTKKLISSAVRRFCNSVDGIIAPSNAIKEYLLQQKIIKPIVVIPSPLREMFLTHPMRSLYSGARPDASSSSAVNTCLENLPCLPKPWRRQVEGYLQAPHNFNLLVVSRFVPEKNIPFIFDVFKQLPNNFTLMLVGYGSDYQRTQQLAFNTLKLSPQRVHFIHKPPQDELLKAYRSADLFIFSSHTDTQGIVLAEAMSQGLPVIAVDGPGQRDIVKNDYNGFIIKNAEKAVTKIMDIAHDETLLNKLISGAYATAQRYHAHNTTQQLITFYHEIKT
jgi:1,2-diacylglycerol 3-alpha-glucosyltransferase